MSFFKTRLTELFGIEYPIVQGGMAAGLVSTAELAAAVANAGGIGFMCAIQWAEDLTKMEDEIRKVKDMTDKPFGINVTLFRELDASWFERVFDLIEKHEVPALETSARSPEPWVKRIKEIGIPWSHKVARVRDGIKAAKLGADALTIIGSEEGGHPGAERSATSVVGPLLVDQVDVPVAIGGGFCDGRGLAAVLAMGGEAVYMGTRFCASDECVIHPKVKQRLVEMAYNETDYILMSIGDPVRAVRNQRTQKILEVEQNEGAEGLIKFLKEMRGEQEGFGFSGPTAMNTGDTDAGILPLGMVSGRINEIKPVKQIVDDIVAEADQVINKLAARTYWKAQ
ncbi:MAG: nitronate monooxygenase [Proteobacteria bacterium]|nr:nitronate monooxygenase [Pseudomonadota bacterium]